VTTADTLNGFIVAAPSSGSGKTFLTLSLLFAFSARGRNVGSFKVGPDYIDPGFHAAASGRPCINLDPWAMREETIQKNLSTTVDGSDLVIGEGVMGLFDGAAGGDGSTADLAESIGFPVVLVVDASGQAASAAALVHGFAQYRPTVNVAGVIFNRVGGPRHRDMLLSAMADRPTSVFGCVPRDPDLTLPERHLGLVLANEHTGLEAFLERAAAHVTEHIDLNALAALSIQPPTSEGEKSPPIPPLGQRIAVARDDAFAFAYPHVLNGWREAGATIETFSPLANEVLPTCDAIYLPGGYPELHAATLSANQNFMDGLRSAAQKQMPIFGECGGYMMLGEGIIDAKGDRHSMSGLLPLETSFAERRLHLGYRDAILSTEMPFGSKGNRFRGHEFHYATVLREDGDEPVFTCRDSMGNSLSDFGRRVGSVSGSFLHLIDRQD
jgi:cobyrinic acid a,c-diamide synthase